MCGIVGYVGNRPAQDIILGGLRKLEYRGYDSAGMSLLEDGEIQTVRAVGNLDHLEAELESRAGGTATATLVRPATIGIGHTRWATHGRVSVQNAHPLAADESRIHVVVNGIVSNYMELRTQLLQSGCVFATETDAEVIAHLIATNYSDDLADAVIQTLDRLDGYFAFVAMALEEPHVLVGARRECPLVVGRGEEESFLASALPAFLAHTNRIQYIENGEIVVLRAGSVEIRDAAGAPREREIETIEWDEETAEKGGYETFMLKEIHEQTDALAETIADRTASGHSVDLSDSEVFDEDILRGVERVTFIGCGTAYHAGLLGRAAIEAWARLHVEVDVASEYRYRSPILGPGDLVVGISQSGETADTLAAMRLARERGARVIALTNTMGSQATRDSDAVLLTRAGLEVGVAATKTFTAQVAAVFMLALRLAELRETLPAERIAELVAQLRHMPELVEELLERVGPAVEEAAEWCWQAPFFLYIGRQEGVAVALEGALKLKEIAYVSTDAYASGEMKHGPIALLDEQTPVVAVATASPVLSRVVDNIETVQARGAKVIAITTEGDATVAPHVATAIPVPATDPMFQPLLATIPLQLLAYSVARRRGLNVDQPRNLAKTVTVE
ncbi:MAG TPA: glutamine--fructose-6-phosphate transaminase (isomerizing) [Solirubrobacteraceae bacterium]|nr:glutamine--fructose-6-phosphate transaminase (isomerizing) [Solirubrobacteraceae bacterium]